MQAGAGSGASVRRRTWREEGELVSMMDAISRLGRSRQVILALVLKGALKARMISGRVFIDRATLDEYMRRAG